MIWPRNSICIITSDFCVLLFNLRTELVFLFDAGQGVDVMDTSLEIPPLHKVCCSSVPLCKRGRVLGACYCVKHSTGLISFNSQKTPELGEVCKCANKPERSGGLPRVTDPPTARHAGIEPNRRAHALHYSAMSSLFPSCRENSASMGLTFGADDALWGAGWGRCALHYKMFNTVPGFYPLHASNTPTPLGRPKVSANIAGFLPQAG